MSFSSFYIGATGLKTQAEGMNSIGHNIANVNTLAYKEENMHFATLMSTGVTTGEPIGRSQKGLGVAVADVITNFTQGSVEPGSSFSDLAIEGKGYFKVVNNGDVFYTRAGNFRFDSQGFLVDPHGNRLQAWEIADSGDRGSLGDLRLTLGADGSFVMPAKATSSLSVGANLGMQEDVSVDEANPFFSLLSHYQMTGDAALEEDSFGYIDSMRIYDENGDVQPLNIFYDQVGVEDMRGYKHYEFVVALDREGLSNAASESLTRPLLAGVLSFDGEGNLVNMAGYTLASGGSPQNLADWTLAPISAEGGLALTVNLPGRNGETLEQTLSLDFGMASSTGAWAASGAGTAADLGTDYLLLPDFGGESTGEGVATTAMGGASGLVYSSQDGYATGYLQNMTIGTDGLVTGIYSNGNSQNLYQIPLYYFTNPYGLEHEGGNLLSATPESGEAIEGAAEDKAAGLGSLHENSLETSNVDLADEFVAMIMIQRGFQSNSKVISTTEQMLQTAVQMKR